MAGLGKQGQRKAAHRAVDMSASVDCEPEQSWYPPPPEECEDDHRYTVPPDGANVATDRVKVRLRVHAATQLFVEFALVQQAHVDGTWQDVVEADSCHDVDVHLHRYALRTGARIGDPEVIVHVRNLDDLQKGYDLAYTEVFERWSDNRQRWERA